MVMHIQDSTKLPVYCFWLALLLNIGAVALHHTRGTVTVGGYLEDFALIVIVLLYGLCVLEPYRGEDRPDTEHRQRLLELETTDRPHEAAGLPQHALCFQPCV